MEVKEEILNGAYELFMRYGVKSITMDDIARHLSMSKKTIYQYYEDKEALVTAFAELEMSQQLCKWDIIENASEDMIECMMKASNMMKVEFGKMNPVLLYDLRKYHPSAWKRFETFKRDHVYNHIKKMLERGVSQGYFRKDAHIDILTKMRIWQIEFMFNPEVFPSGHYNLTEVCVQLFDHFIFGISTIKGHERLNQLKELSE